MISVISGMPAEAVIYCMKHSGASRGRREEKAMKIGMEELEDLREELERLLEFIRGMEKGELPYFYRYFLTMKLNIEMFFCIGDRKSVV